MYKISEALKSMAKLDVTFDTKSADTKSANTKSADTKSATPNSG